MARLYNGMTEAEILVAGKNIFFGDNVFLNPNVTFIDVVPIHLIREIEDDTPEDARQS